LEVGTQVIVSPELIFTISWLKTILFPSASLFSISIDMSPAKHGEDSSSEAINIMDFM
jgi:hypothetical protein